MNRCVQVILAGLALAAVSPGPSSVLCSAAHNWPELLEYNPTATEGAVVTSPDGHARFTVLTPRLIRIEYSGQSLAFEDRATTAIVNRALDVPSFKVSNTSAGELLIQTQDVLLSYKVGSKFAPDTLSVAPSPSSSDSGFGGWAFGDKNPQNLLGTIKSLDQLGVTSLNCTENSNITVHDEDLHCAWGLVSRSGWAAFDDSQTYALDQTGWWVGPNSDDVDMYLFAHGLDYKGALSDFVKISGRPALPPRAAFGLWWTRWYNLNSADVRQVVEEYKTHALPLDVFVLDMDWHIKPAWGAYSWDRRLFPSPGDTVRDYLKGVEGLITLANVHDDNGVAANEDQHAAMVAALGLKNKTADIPFTFCTSQDYAAALEDVVLAPLEADGLDYWWIDWQQGGKQGGCAGKLQNPTIWTNKVRSTDHIRRGSDKRGLILARWGGMGSHRYQVGFSGDVAGVDWNTLAYQPYFSMTSTNVGYGFWSHDIVGPGGNDVALLEVYTRWLQWAAYSGVFRSHDRGSSAGGCAATFPQNLTSDTCTVVKPWNVPERFASANRDALMRRATMLPYTYTLARVAYDTGLGPLRPMYYEFPKLDASYWATKDGDFPQYFFGDDMIVSPVVQPSSSNNSYLAPKKWWIPPGSWIEQESGQMLTGAADGSTVVDRKYDLGEVPILVRAGAIIPSRPVRTGDTIGVAARQYGELIFSVYPGSTSGSTDVYEDDGESTRYVDGKFAYSSASYSRSSDSGDLKFQISTKGTYESLPAQRKISLRIVNGAPVSSISINGEKADIPYQRYPGNAPSWTYEGATATTVIALPAQATATTMTVDITFTDTDVDTAGIRGRISRALAAKHSLDAIRKTPGAHAAGYGKLDAVAVAGDVLARAAGSSSSGDWKTLAQQLGGKSSSMFNDAIAEVAAVKLSGASGANRMKYLAGLLEGM